VDAMPRRETINADTYVSMLTEFTKHFKWVWPHKNPTEILLQHDNARLHTSLKTREDIKKFGWTALLYPPYRPDLASSDLHLFGVLKDAIHGTNIQTDDDVICTVRTWLCEQDKADTHLFLVGARP
jgi:hypothetical protein